MSAGEQSDWIEWSGGECPVDPYARVEVRLRNGRETRDMVQKGWHAADSLSWEHFNDRRRSTDIIAYRVVPKEATLAQANPL